jgi:hypothetical protein
VRGRILGRADGGIERLTRIEADGTEDPTGDVGALVRSRIWRKEFRELVVEPVVCDIEQIRSGEPAQKCAWHTATR